MLERVVVHNFQSLKKADIELGRFTVIVGPSSSGKSAFMRAVRALSSGLRGNSTITVGEKSLSITAYTEENIVTLERGKVKGQYLITNRTTGEVDKFTKLAAAVPEAVSQALRIQPITKEKSSINFAGQHDLPFLLGDTASTVAKVLGDLTNVSTIFEAVRLANKKKLATGTLLKTRQQDLDSLLEQAQSFQGLAARRVAVEAAEKALEALTSLEGTRARLETAVASLEASEALMASYQELPSVPDAGKLVTLQTTYKQCRQKIMEWAHAEQQIKQLSKDVDLARELEVEAQRAFNARLVELGKCPTCGQEITEEEHHD